MPASAAGGLRPASSPRDGLADHLPVDELLAREGDLDPLAVDEHVGREEFKAEDVVNDERGDVALAPRRVGRVPVVATLEEPVE